MSEKWLKAFEEIGMIWRHDGNPKRPYAKLSSEQISDGYANCTPLIACPQMLHEALKELVGRYKLPEKPCVIVGQAMGSITVASHLALITGAKCCWSVKTNNNTMQIDSRFDLDKNVPAIMAEDVITTFGTTRKTNRALQALQVPVKPHIYTLINRLDESTVEGLEIRALLTLNFATWDWGHNPHTNGSELVSAVRPKENWKALTQDYV